MSDENISLSGDLSFSGLTVTASVETRGSQAGFRLTESLSQSELFSVTTYSSKEGSGTQLDFSLPFLNIGTLHIPGDSNDR